MATRGRKRHSPEQIIAKLRDANDAHGIAQMMRTSFFKEITVKSFDSHRLRTLLGARAQLVGIRTDLKNQVRGILKTFGFTVSQSIEKGFEAKVWGTITEQPLLQKMVTPLMEVLQTVQEQVTALDKLLADYAANDKICRHLMTIPGVGPVTAVAFTAAVDDPTRFKKSRTVGAYFGLTNRPYQSLREFYLLLPPLVSICRLRDGGNLCELELVRISDRPSPTSNLSVALKH